MADPPTQLDQARRRVLDGLRQAHARAPTATTAIAQAQAEWMCGEYDAAIPSFIEARDRAPHMPGNHLALASAASLLTMHDLHASAIDAGRRLHPHDAPLALQAALRLLPGHFDEALSLVSGNLDDPRTAMYARALRALAENRPPEPWSSGQPTFDAAWAGFRWMSRYADREAFMGLPTAVLSYALQRAPAQGTTLECGVYFGRSLRIIADATSGPVHGFDSFEGLPEAWHANEPKGAYSTGRRLPPMPPNVQLHAGWFDRTLPAFFASQRQPIRLLHVDCDIYASTRSVLEQADEYLVPGSIIVFDDFVGYAGYEAHELRAFEEYVERCGIAWTFLCGCLLGRVVALRIVGRR